jgi:uncharacterized repeat protein (TIGR01451 family)
VPCLDPEVGSFSIVGGGPQLPLRLEAGECVTLSWTLHCDSPGFTPINLTFSGYGDHADECPECWPVFAQCCTAVDQYPAAHLEVEIIDAPTSVPVSTIFDVTAVITNTGVADAWEPFATLSVFPEGSIRVVDGGYTKQLDTLVGHDQDGSVEVTWTVHCKQACESEITVTAGGLDEYGYHTKQRWSDYCDFWVLDLEPEAGRPIDPRFIEPDSVTVKQMSSVGLDLEITKDVIPTEPEPGDNVTYTIVVHNYGPGDASGVEVTESMPAELISCETVDPTPTQGSYDAGTGVWTVGNMAAGTSATLMLKCQVDPQAETGQVVNEVTVTADQADGIPGNNTDDALIDIGSNFDISLVAGWNLISSPYYIEPGDRAIADFLSPVIGNGTVDVVWAYGACGAGWSNFATIGPAGTLTEMRDGPGYWVFMNAPDTLPITGAVLPLPPQLPPEYPVCVGWNLIGFRGNSPRLASDYLAGVDFSVIYAFESGIYSLVTSGDNLNPSQGYWIAILSPGTIRG